MSRGVGHRCSSDPALLWLWCMMAAAAPILPLDWELPYTSDVGKKEGKKKRLKERKGKKEEKRKKKS